MIFRVTRYVLYTLLFACSTVLLGLTAYRVHYTKSLDFGDILTTRSHFYDPRIVGLLVASILAVIFSLMMLGLMIGSVDILIAEHISLWVLWIFFLITAALVTRQFSNLKWCRSHHKVCSVLETIKAFSWICWGFLTFLLIATFTMLLLPNDSRSERGATRGTRGSAAAATAYPDTRQATTGATIHDQPRTQATTQGVTVSQGAPTTHVTSAKQNAYATQQQQSAPVNPQSGTTAGALYKDHPVADGTVYTGHPTDQRHIV